MIFREMNTMERRNGIRIGWIRLIVALALSFTLSCFNAMAQNDSGKPLDAKSLTALVEELKGVVSNSSTDEKDAALITEKWERRKDLVGKTKSDVINLLYGDVKAVVKDSGVLYQIYSMFSFYKQMPDESQPPTAPPRGGNMYEEPWHPAARFAVSEGGKKEKANIALVKVEKADFETGKEEGLTFQMCLAVDVQKGSKKAVRRYARTTVFRNDKISDETMAYSLKSWKLSKALPPNCH